mmetsp:Transcript_18238/g.42236  ORF Transcript_18238/g.42236 Transcript_18238/m.42236 type:complete len:254 (+) Transcript_18238:279-1040(+)
MGAEDVLGLSGTLGPELTAGACLLGGSLAIVGLYIGGEDVLGLSATLGLELAAGVCFPGGTFAIVGPDMGGAGILGLPPTFAPDPTARLYFVDSTSGGSVAMVGFIIGGAGTLDRLATFGAEEGCLAVFVTGGTCGAAPGIEGVAAWGRSGACGPGSGMEPCFAGDGSSRVLAIVGTKGGGGDNLSGAVSRLVFAVIKLASASGSSPPVDCPAKAFDSTTDGVAARTPETLEEPEDFAFFGGARGRSSWGSEE